MFCSNRRTVMKLTIGKAVARCERMGLGGRELAAYAQRLVHDSMRYSYSNTLDRPAKAFEKGRGFCYQQAGALNAILNRLGFESRLVYAAKVIMPEKEVEGVKMKARVSGHVWCRVLLNGAWVDVCPGSGENTPGVLHFETVSRVRNWNALVAPWAIAGSAAVNAKRERERKRQRAREAARSDPELCSCRKKSCPRYKNCEACREHHRNAGNGLPDCERT